MESSLQGQVGGGSYRDCTGARRWETELWGGLGDHQLREYFAGPADSTGRCTWPLLLPPAGMRHGAFAATAPIWGLCLPLSFCLPSMRLALTPSWVTKPRLPLPGDKRTQTSDQKGCPAARPQLRGESGSTPAPLRSSAHSTEGSVKAPGFRLSSASVLGLGLEVLPVAQGSK